MSQNSGRILILSTPCICIGLSQIMYLCHTNERTNPRRNILICVNFGLSKVRSHSRKQVPRKCASACWLGHTNQNILTSTGRLVFSWIPSFQLVLHKWAAAEGATQVSCRILDRPWIIYWRVSTKLYIRLLQRVRSLNSKSMSGLQHYSIDEIMVHQFSMNILHVGSCE